MKKILTMALIAASTATLSAQKQVVDQAGKMAGKLNKTEEARALIQQAESNPETAKDVRTYYTGGKIEFGAFEEAFKKRAINPDDKAVNLIDMGNELVNGYNYFMKALPLDSIPNEKGEVKPKYSKEMLSKINSHHGDYFNYGGELFNNKHYYPEAYNAFMIYGDMPSQSWAEKTVKATPDSMVSLAYHYAGIGAYSGNNLPDALIAFKKARLAGIKDPKNYVYEIACWQNIALRDSTQEEAAKNAIQEIARHGYDSFGISDPLFINNLINSMLQNGKYDDAVELISKQIKETPDKPFLYGLRAYVYDRMDKDEASVEDYKMATSMDNADFETLKNASKKLYTTGTALLNALEGNQPAKRQELKANYFETAKAVAERAKAMHPDDSDINYVIENIDYALETYF